MAIQLEGFSSGEEKMIEQAIQALQGLAYNTGIIKLLVRADLPIGVRGMTLFAFGGAALGQEAFSSPAMLNHVLEEELLHLLQMAAEQSPVFGPDTAKVWEDAVHEVRRFHRPP